MSNRECAYCRKIFGTDLDFSYHVVSEHSAAYEAQSQSEPTFTLAQVKEIVEAIAVRVEAITDIEVLRKFGWDGPSRGVDLIDATQEIAAKLIRATE